MKTLLPYFVKAIFFAAFIFSATTVSAQVNDQDYSVTGISLIKKDKSYVQLDWSGHKKDISYFVIERSTDGKNFHQAAMEFTSEDPQFTDYKYRDKDLKSSTGAIYYRIGLVNAANDVTYLPAKKIVLNLRKASFPD